MSAFASSCTTGNIPSISSFAYNIFKLLTSSPTSESNVNVLISPFSIATALALALAGSTIDSVGQTEIQSVLNIQNHSEIPLLSRSILSSVEIPSSSTSSPIELTSANSIWTTEDIKQDYIRTVENVHAATADVLPKKYEPINDFIKEKTKGMISKVLEGDVDPLTRAILVNAVYFKGNWKEQFDKAITTKGVFHAVTKDGVTESRDAMLMFTNRKTKVGQHIEGLAGSHAVLLEYGNESEENAKFGALFLLPPNDTENAMQSMISSLSSYMSSENNVNETKTATKAKKSLNSLLQYELFHEKVNLTMPRFRISYGVKSIKPELKSLGIKAVFEKNEMFYGMSSDPLVYLDDVFHKAVMEVTEEGTVAAAATVGIAMTRSIPRPPVEMRFDRPFVMMILHLESGTPLFISKVDDPEFII